MTVERMIELLEIEKECVLRNASGECNRYCAGCDLLQDDTELHEMYTEALTLLKAQEPRVMTWQEVIGAAIECKPLYVEVKDSEDKEPGNDRWAMATQYKDSITNGMIRVMSSYITSEVFFKDRYGKTWRCWTSRPTAEQRKAVK